MSREKTPSIAAIVREVRLLRTEISQVTKLIRQEKRLDDRLISVKEAARMLNRSPDYIYDLIHTGRLGTSRPTPTSNHLLSENEIRRYLNH